MPSRSQHLLLVDDRPDTLQQLTSVFADEGFSVTSARRATEALVAFEGTTVDVMVSDVRMPHGIEGIELTQVVKARNGSLPCVLYTAMGTSEEEELALQSGADDYVLPFFGSNGHRVLINAVRTAVDGLQTRVEHSARQAPVVERVVAASPAMRSLVRKVHRLAVENEPVLIMGETGTGKEVIARALHTGSTRARASFEPVNCGAIPVGLAEATLFGHLRGSFTGSHEDKAGLVEVANGGTLFLDEVGELPEALQVLLLRFLETGEFRRVGDTRLRYADVRIITATNRPLDVEAANGRFRSDLFWRIAREVFRIPPLRERPEDITAFVDQWCVTGRGDAPFQITPEALALLLAHPWPGNMRELRSVLDQAGRRSFQRRIDRDEIAAMLRLCAPPGKVTPTAAVYTEMPLGSAQHGNGRAASSPIDKSDERTRVEKALAANRYRVGRTATSLGISRSSLYRWLKRLNLR